MQAPFAQALAHYQQNQTEAAEELCRGILRAHPRHFDAAHLLGAILLDRGQPQAAERQIRAAIRINPNVSAAHNSRGIALKDLDRLLEALASFNRAVELDPHSLEALANRGAALHALKRFDEALASYDAALALSPAFAGVLCNRSNTLIELKRFEDALSDLKKAALLAPLSAEAFNSRGLALHGLKRFDEALGNFARAIALRPLYAEPFHNLGNSLRELERSAEALDAHERAIALKRDFPDAESGRGLALHGLKRIDEALAAYDRALALRPLDYEALNNRAHCELAAGLMAEGWRDAEYRWLSKSFNSPRPALSAPEWKGEPLEGRSILIYAEQGYGDMIQFCRYLPLLAERGAQVSFLAPPFLRRLFAGLADRIRMIASLEEDGPFDRQCALMSLPYRFGTDLTNIPCAVPYLSVEPERSAFWAKRIGKEGFRVGICWQGNASSLPGRSFPLSELVPLSSIDGVRLISLQKGQGAEQLAQVGSKMRIETLGEDFDAGDDAFLDSAAVIPHLDLVVSCDTSIAHLAGALARPTWIALKYVPDWRWMLDRSDSPWYPTARLYRQAKPRDWKSVIVAMTADLKRAVTTLYAAGTGADRQ